MGTWRLSICRYLTLCTDWVVWEWWRFFTDDSTEQILMRINIDETWEHLSQTGKWHLPLSSTEYYLLIYLEASALFLSISDLICSDLLCWKKVLVVVMCMMISVKSVLLMAAYYWDCVGGWQSLHSDSAERCVCQLIRITSVTASSYNNTLLRL